MRDNIIVDKEYVPSSWSEELDKEISSVEVGLSDDEFVNSIFRSRAYSGWIESAKALPKQSMLFSEFWLEGEICILFANTNMGKTALAVQIGDSISKGVAMSGFKLEVPRQVVLYFDFELNERQLLSRYSVDGVGVYPFDDNFIRVDFNPDLDISLGNFKVCFNAAFEAKVLQFKAKVLIIDNISYLLDEPEKAKIAIPLMRHLKRLKSKLGLSILVLAHAPKRDLSQPITQNDMHGSKMLMNFTDTCLAIGESTKDPSVRYLKQIKARSTAIVFNSENVCICEVVKSSNFLCFDFLRFGREVEHLRVRSDKDRDSMVIKVKSLYDSDMSLREIGVELGVSHMTVKRILED